MMPPDLNPTANNRGTLQKLKPPQLAAATALVLDIAGAMPAARQAIGHPTLEAVREAG